MGFDWCWWQWILFFVGAFAMLLYLNANKDNEQ